MDSRASLFRENGLKTCFRSTDKPCHVAHNHSGHTHARSETRIGLRTKRQKELPVNDDKKIPAHSFDRVEKLSSGEIAEIEIELLPIGLVFHSGEPLRFVISSKNLLGTLMPAIEEFVGANSGQHVIHTGGAHPSYLQLPIRAR
jgi:hypothetical protein